jgi:O-antigen ligase
MSHLSAIAAFHAELALLPERHPRRVGLTAMRFGIIALTAALPLGVAVQHIAMLGIALPGAMMARAPLHRMPGFRIAVAFALWQMISLGLTVLLDGNQGNPQRGLGLMYIWLAVPVGLVAFADLAVRRRALGAVAATLTASTFVASLQFFVGRDETAFLNISWSGLGRHHHGTGFAPIHLTQGFIMALLAFLFLHQPAIAGPLPATLRWGMGGLATFAVLIAKARSAYLALPLAFACSVAARGGRRLLLGGGVLLLGLGVMVTALLIIDPARLARAAKLDDGRWAIWRVSTTIIAEHPLIGCGGAKAYEKDYIRLFPQVNPGVWDETRGEGHAHAHNSLLTIACEHGLPAMLLYLAFLGALLNAAWRMRATAPRRWELALGVTALALGAGMFENLAAHTAPSYATWTALALALSATAQDEPRQV